MDISQYYTLIKQRVCILEDTSQQNVHNMKVIYIICHKYYILYYIIRYELQHFYIIYIYAFIHFIKNSTTNFICGF